MIFEQSSSVASSCATFHAGTRKSMSDFQLPLLKQPMKFVEKLKSSQRQKMKFAIQ